MRVGQRLFLAVLPAVLGVLLVAALAYWGQYAHQAPTALVAFAIAASIVSLVMAWTNTRYVARRLERLASPGAPTATRMGAVREALATAVRGSEAAAARAGPDEIDAIEKVVDHLSSAVAHAETHRAEQEASADERRREYADLLASTAEAVGKRLEEIRLPLHILLENRFGDLNENQEEMLGAARAAAESADAEVVRLRAIADLDRGAVRLRRDRVSVGEVLRALLPILQADAERVGATLTTELGPALPSIRADRRALQMGLEVLLRDGMRRTSAESEARLTADVDGAWVVIRLTHGPGEPVREDAALARRIIDSQGGTVDEAEGETVVRLPR